MVFDSLVSKWVTNAHLNYIEGDGYTYTIQALIWGVIYAIPAIILKCITSHFNSKSYEKPPGSSSFAPLLNEVSEEVIVKDGGSQNLPIQELRDSIKRPRKFRPRWLKVLTFLGSTLVVLSILSFAVAPSVASSVGLISLLTSTMITFLIYIIVEFMAIRALCPSKARALIKGDQFKDVQSNKPQFIRQIYFAYKLHPYLFIFITLLGLIYVFVVPQITAGSCMAYYSPRGTVSFGPFWISTSFSRWLTLSKVCAHGKICRIYSTLPEDSSTGVILNVHTGIDVDTLTASYGTKADFEANKPLRSSKTGIDLKMEIDTTGERYIHAIFIDGLNPNTDYYVQFLYNGNSLGDANFRTLPSSNMESNLVMVVGGDSSGSDLSSTFIQEATKYNPDVILVGGDIVYDNGDFNCYYCWDYYLSLFDDLNKNSGRLIPLVLAVGNHDVGQDDFEFLDLDKNRNSFFLMFPQHTVNTSEAQVPLPDERLSYFYHKIGNMLHVTLDSGYLIDYDGQQNWLSTVANENPTLAKFAHYHVPMIPACYFRYDYDPRMDSWVQVFEQTRFMTVFENHVHLFKRTFPQKMTQFDGPGVTYIGDGAWGINPESCYEEDSDRNITQVFDTMGNVNHIWIVNVSATTVDYKAINVTGDAIDTYSQKIAHYI